MVVSAELVHYAPIPWLVHGTDGFGLMKQAEGEAARSIGWLMAFHEQLGMFVQALGLYD